MTNADTNVLEAIPMTWRDHCYKSRIQNLDNSVYRCVIENGKLILNDFVCMRIDCTAYFELQLKIVPGNGHEGLVPFYI